MTQTNKNLSLNKKLALTGAFSALIIVLTITHLGFIPIGTVASITILQIPVILIALLSGLPEGIFVGAVFGIMSMIMAFISPSSVLDPFFQNPLCSVLPRILLGVCAWAFWKLFNLIPKMPKIISAGLAGFLATIAHTLLVYGCIFIFKGSDMREALTGMGLTTTYFGVVMLGIVNEVLEAVASTLVCVAVYTGLYFTGKRKSKLSAETEE